MSRKERTTGEANRKNRAKRPGIRGGKHGDAEALADAAFYSSGRRARSLSAMMSS